MFVKKPFSQTTATLIAFLGCFFLLGQPTLAEAGCGCDKPPPTPAAVIPNVAFSQMPITLFDHSLQEGQQWQVTFQNGSTTTTVPAAVVMKRYITDPSEKDPKPLLVVPVPNIPPGPTRILASSMEGGASFFVPEGSFTVIGKPVVVSEQTANYHVKNYTTAVDHDGTLYISVGGLNNVCQAMEFTGSLKKYPLRFAEGDIVIWNPQGFLIDLLGAGSATHFAIEQKSDKDSNELYYFRHSFEKYCADHQSGGSLVVNPQDPNWHLKDGTPHVDYSIIIFAIAGHFDDGSVPATGSVSFDLKVKTQIIKENKAQRYQEEGITGAK